MIPVITTEQQLSRLIEFIEQKYRAELLENTSKGIFSLDINFSTLSSFDPEMAELLLETPEDVIYATESAVKHFDLGSIETIRIRFFNLPEARHIDISEMRKKHLGKFIAIEGLVRQKSDVRPQVVNVKFECPSCGTVLSVVQEGKNFREPERCGCGRKGKFRTLAREMIDAQTLVLEENPEEIESPQAKRIDVLLKDELVTPFSERKTNPGSKIRVTGILKELQRMERGRLTTQYDLVFETNHVEALETDYENLKITKEEKKSIIALAKTKDVYEKLINSLAPSIYGYKEIKEALILQSAGGIQKTRKDSIVSRGDIHILLVGDPGAGKSQLLKRLSFIAPKSRYVAGKGVSGAGLTAAVVRNDVLGGWSLEAGALVLANKGMVAIDEMDKMSEQDTSAMHEAMEQQTVSVSKANIQATLQANTTILAAANPKFGRFNPDAIIAEQIALPPTLISRFDLVFPIKDEPDKKKDSELANHILKLHQNPNQEDSELSSDFLRKFISYVRTNCNPKLTTNAKEMIEKFYIKMRNSASKDEITAKSIPISARQLEAIVRLSEAAAKLRLSEEVEEEDVERSIKLIRYYLEQVGTDPETGQLDIDRITSGISASTRNKRIVLLTIIDNIIKETKGEESAELTKIIREAEEKGLQENEVTELLQKMKQSGDIYEPKRAYYKKTWG